MQISQSQRTGLGWIVWIVVTAVFLGVISKQVRVTDPDTGETTLSRKIYTNTVVPAYRDASLHWIKGENLYDLKDNSVHGYLYLPSAAVLMTPLALLPNPVHEYGWRILILALLAYVTWRLSEGLRPHLGEESFLFMTLLVLPVSLGSARAGQMNIVIAATMALAAIDLVGKRWGWATFWLGLGFALKPQAIVMLLIVGAVVKEMRWRACLAIAAALLLPFLAQWPNYAIEQWQLCFAKLSVSSRPGEAGVHNSDLIGLLGGLGFDPPNRVHWMLRLIAAPLALVPCWIALRRDLLQGALMMLAMATCYLMLFNPRTEGGSYIMPAMPLAAHAAWAFAKERRWLAGTFLIVIAIGWAASFEVSRLLWSMGHATKLSSAPSFRESYGPYFLSPMLAIFFIVFLVHLAATKRGPRLNASPG